MNKQTATTIKEAVSEKDFISALSGKLARYYNVTMEEAGKEQYFGAL